MHPPIPTVIGYTRGDLDDSANNPFDRALDLFIHQVELTQQVQQVIGQKPHLEPSLVRLEFMTTGLVPTESVFAFLDSILYIGPTVINFDHLFRR